MEGKHAASSAKKRQRSENWLEEDKIILKELVKERVGVIENKNTDTNTNAKKVAAWASLYNSFNGMCVGTPRTLAQLKAQWGLIKMKAKKQKSLERREYIKTGGGPPPLRNPPDSDDLSVWLPNEFTVDSNQFDSDQINQKIQTVLHPEVMTINNIEPEVASDILTVIIQENEDEVHDKTEAIAGPQNPPPPSPSSPPPSASTYNYKPGNRKNMINKVSNKTSSAAEKIAATEIACRKELHQAQLANEQKKAAILDLEEILLKKKIEYYTKKNDNIYLQ